VRRIGSGAFHSCRQLNSVNIPNTVTNIADYAFYTSGLTNLSIPGPVNSIGNSAFAYCPFLSTVQLGTGIVTIGDGAFISARLLTSLVIPDSVKVIGDQTFYDLISLTNLVIGSQVFSIGWGAFDGDAMTSVIIPASVTNIGIGAFEFCNNLQAFYFKGSPPTIGQSSLGDNPLVRIYYLPGTGGWSSSFGGLVTQPWVLPNPIILSPSQQGNQFGFTISWATNLPVVVEASTDLMKPGWQPLQTNALIGGSFYFRDAQSTNYPGRFYRVRSP
jgi:hypothetical protein